jgi:hypothetical protein
MYTHPTYSSKLLISSFVFPLLCGLGHFTVLLLLLFLLLVMGDDMANNWGTTLCFLSPARERDKYGNDLGDGGLAVLKNAVASTFQGEFVLTKVANCGSDANLFAVVEATRGDLGGCMIAAGSYVSGVTGGLQNWSTSKFCIQSGPSVIQLPDDVQAHFTREHTIGLPYYIEGVYEPNVINEYEDQCLQELHVRCLLAKCNNHPFKTLLLELMLAGCGAILSDRALERIAALAKHHNFNIVIDECMTAARTGTMLMLEQKPVCFREVVAYLTMGKWMDGGLLLTTKNELQRKEEHPPDETSVRGPSTVAVCSQVRNLWQATEELIGNCDERRKLALKKLKVTEKQCWGKGVLIFAPIRRGDSNGGLKNRFLPMLTDTPLLGLGNNKKTMFNEWSKKQICDLVMDGARAWATCAPEVYSVLTDNIFRHFCTRLAVTAPGCQMPPSALFPDLTPMAKQKFVWDVTVSHELVAKSRVGTKRTAAGYPKPASVLPWIAGVSGSSIHAPVQISGQAYVGARLVNLKTGIFGRVWAYNPKDITTRASTNENQEDTWSVLYDDAVYLHVPVTLQELTLMKHDYAVSTEQDHNRYTGDKVALLIELGGSQYRQGCVTGYEFNAETEAEEFIVEYAGSLPDQRYGEMDIQHMKIHWAQYFGKRNVFK